MRSNRPVLSPWIKPVLCAAVLLALSAPRTLGEEGLWTFDNPPVTALQEKYGFTPTRDWLDRVRLSSLRLNDGGSGSFVSADGLLLTNSHVASGQLQKVSTDKHDYRKDGFYAKTRAEEIKCPDLEINVLVSMEEVTDRVQKAVKEKMSAAEALKARRAEAGKIEKESLDATGLRSDVVALYQGGEYWLYRYKKYTDLRMVFAPESQIAYFGGDPDNFTYPRYDLDMALLRVYENGKPLKTEHYLKWSPKGAEPGELVFVSGNPGTTARLKTCEQLETERDFVVPMALAGLKRRVKVLQDYAALGAEEAPQAAAGLLSFQNGVKVREGLIRSLTDPKVMQIKQKMEKEFKAKVAGNGSWQQAYGSAWDDVSRAESKRRKMYKVFYYRRMGGYRLPSRALTLVRYVAEARKPDGERLQEFHEAGLESVRFQLLSPAPLYPKLEEAMLADSLAESLEALGPDDPFLQAVLEGKAPAEAAHRLISGTRLADAAFRKSLLDGGEAAVAASQDPLIALARKVDPMLREARKQMEDEVDSVEVQAGEKIGQARFAAYGKSAYPDATFTLRLSYGTVAGYPMNGTLAPPFTTLYGLYERAYAFGLKPPFDLPERYLKRKGMLDLASRLDFVTTNDVIGGNSGSPVVNKSGELVGLIFDGNIESLLGDYLYDGDTNRSIAVHPAAMLHLLRKAYDAGPLADELEGKATVQAKR